MLALAIAQPSHGQAVDPRTHQTTGAADARPRLNSTGRDIPLGGPLLDNGFVLGQVDYVLTADDQVVVEISSLLPLLAPMLGPRARGPLETALAGRATVSGEELERLGYKLTYDPGTFSLAIAIPAALRPSQSISLSGGAAGPSGPLLEPEAFSAYLTVLGNLDYVHRGPEKGLSDPNLQFDSAVRMGGFVLENQASYQGRFSRETTRLVYDDRGRTARYAAGDLRPVSRGFAGSAPMAGVSLERIYSDLEPQRNVQPRGQRSFTLTRSSTVETFVNGTLVQQTRLGPGNYDIRDFPFAQGANDIRLVVRDDTGRENVLDFSINFDRTLLSPGLAEFGVYAGVQTPFSSTGRRYSSRPIASGFYRRGINQSFTAGGNFQVGDRGGVAGAEAVWATPLGTLGFDLAASHLKQIGSGYAFNASFERNFARGTSGSSSLLVTYQTTSRRFGAADTVLPSNPFAHEFGVTYSQGFARNHFVTADGFYSVGRDGRPDQKTARLSYGWRANQRLFLTAEASYQDRGTVRESGVRVSLTYRFTARSSMTAELDSQREGGRVQYQTSSGRGVGSYNAQGAIDYFDGVGSFNGTANVLLNRAEVGAAHVTSYSRSDRQIVDQRTSLRFGTAIAFAGGSLALSRPIFDSVALFKPHKSLKGADAYVLPNKDEYLGKSGLFGPGVASDLSAYTPQTLTFDAPKAPLGYDLGAGIVQVMPAYRSGYRVDVGSSYAITYTGQLLRDDGEPLLLTAGQAYEEAAPQRPPVAMFTNRAGRFAISGLRPGRWRIETRAGARPVTYIITIPADAEGLVRGGILRPGEQK